MHSYNLQAKLTSSNWHLMLIKGHCGIGKSNKLAEKIKTLCHSDGSSVLILIISDWRSLVYSQKVLFKEFKSYLELDIKKLNSKDTLKLIISPESIHKLGATGYDIIILDEFETIIQNFSRPTMKKLKLSYNIYKSLLQSALLILALDATLDLDSLHIRDKYYALIYINTKKWNAELIGALKQGLKVYILMFASAEIAEALYKELASHGYQDKCFFNELLETKKRDIFANINDAVANLNYLIATPVITCSISIIIENFDIMFAYFRTLASLTSNEAYQMLHYIKKLNQNVVHVLTDLCGDNLLTDCEDLLHFISYRCNVTEYPNLEEAHYNKTFTLDGKWIFKPNASLETHLYNASCHNASRNDFVDLLANRLSECSYDICVAKNCPSIDLKITENNKGKELLLNDIDPAWRLALQKYNLAFFYKKTPEDITENFVKKYSQKKMQNVYSALVQAVNPLDNLHKNYRFMVIGNL
ncbi:7299_t:CDS:2 [Cetraspora pellucida]|uniref:Replication origin-binding protein n=1 Tax=Cetraspora pellucida TaxID=1433469 RepID=A0A9N9AQA7_9GLOM|nr:7299_t:CDS:2 [Cetraspora pellucida]